MSDEIRSFLTKLDELYQAGDGPTGTDYVPSSLGWAIRTARWLLAKDKEAS